MGLTSYGLLAQAALTRGETEEPFELTEVLTVGLFDGIGALRVAAELLHLPVAGHISVECNAAANRVVEASFPGTRHVSSVEGVTAEEVQTWACTYTSVGVVLLGAGPPCQGVSGLNADRKGVTTGSAQCTLQRDPSGERPRPPILPLGTSPSLCRKRGLNGQSGPGADVTGPWLDPIPCGCCWSEPRTASPAVLVDLGAHP